MKIIINISTHTIVTQPWKKFCTNNRCRWQRGSILSQGDIRQSLPIAHASKSLNKHTEKQTSDGKIPTTHALSYKPFYIIPIWKKIYNSYRP